MPRNPNSPLARNGRRNKGFGLPRKPWSEYKTLYRRIDGIRAHRLLVEQRTGIKLPATAEVHHVDQNDTLTNVGLLVVCENAIYHKLLEYRGRALRESGNANWLKCMRCKRWDDPKNLIVKERHQRPGQRYIAHEERGRACVDLTEARPFGAGDCDRSPSRRHKVERPPRIKRRFIRVGLEDTCLHCGAAVRRAHPLSVRWYATKATTVITLRRAKDSAATASSADAFDRVVSDKLIVEELGEGGGECAKQAFDHGATYQEKA